MHFKSVRYLESQNAKTSSANPEVWANYTSSFLHASNRTQDYSMGIAKSVACNTPGAFVGARFVHTDSNHRNAVNFAVVRPEKVGRRFLSKQENLRGNPFLHVVSNGMPGEPARLLQLLLCLACSLRFLAMRARSLQVAGFDAAVFCKRTFGLFC